MSNPQQRSFARVRSPLKDALRTCHGAFLGVGSFSGLINVLALTGSVYMLQLYDRVLPSHSYPTLIGLSIIMFILYAGYGLLDLARTRMLTGVGIRIDRELRERVFNLVMLGPLRARTSGDGLQPIRDLDQIRAFLSGPGPTAFFDLPWMPFYLAIVYLLHPWLGILGLAGTLLLLSIAVLTDIRSRELAAQATKSATERYAFGEALQRSAEVIRALGMGSRTAQEWAQLSERHLVTQARAANIIARYGTLSKVLRLILQSAVLGLGSWLVICGEATGGVMIAASIMVSRALAPVEIAIANWRGFVAARQSKARLTAFLEQLPPEKTLTPLPKPSRSLAVEDLWVAAPGTTKPILQNVTFALSAGEGLGVIGPSASGKSTLARTLVGAWLPQRGTVRLDGATLLQWPADILGQHVGFLPQDCELHSGTIAENISRFEPDAPGELIIAAAQAAGVHDMVVHLADGYDTRVGARGTALSAGQRQRIALARALYRDPFLVVLDEPNSNLDAEGDVALTQAIASVQARGGIAIVIAHRPAALTGLNKLLVLGSGHTQTFGDKDDVLKRAQAHGAAHARLRVLPESGVASIA